MPIQLFSSGPRAGRSALAALTAALWLSGSAGSQAQAQTAALAQAPAALSEQASAPRQATITLEDLRRLVDEQRALIDRQGARLDAQDRDLADLRKRLDASDTLAAEASHAVAELKRQPTAATTTATAEQRTEAVEQSTQRTPEMPAAVVSAGDFPGSIRIPGTESAIKVGGQARMTLVHTLAPLGVDDRFITSSIPVQGSQTAGEDKRTTYTPAASRLNVDLRSPSSVGDFRTFLEWDFAADGNVARLRHAFIQARRWTIGQTWSTFSDREAEPLGIDFEGLNAIYDPATGTLKALQVFSSYFGYERAWKPTFTSAITYGLVRVDNLDSQPADALHETQRGTLNLTWTPITHSSTS